MSGAPRPRGLTIGFVAVIAFLAYVVGPASTTQSVPMPLPRPTQLEAAVFLDRSAYLSGDTATARAVVYRHPAATNYTYIWRARDAVNAILNETEGPAATYAYAIPRSYSGLIRFEAVVDDQEGNTTIARATATVSIAVLALRLDRGEFMPGDTIRAFYNVISNVIVNVTYDYEVRDAGGTTVFNGTTTQPSFAFTTPSPASASYRFRVVARDGPNQTEQTVTISQTIGFVLSITLDKTSYVPGDTVVAHLRLIPRTANQALPLQFRWAMGFPVGSGSVSAITTTQETDLSLPLPTDLGRGEFILFAQELSTAASAFAIVRVGETAQNFLWTTEVGGIPLFAALIALLSIFLLVAVVALWRRVSPRTPGPSRGRAAPPLPPEEPVPTSPTSPMSIACGNCGTSIDLTTSERPIEVICPSCGETQLVT